MGRVIHFEITADDPDRIEKFYTEVFGWKIIPTGGPVDYRMVSTGEPSAPGIDGGIRKRENQQEGTINTIDVKSIEETIEKIVASGGKIVMPKSPIAGIGYMAYCLDCEGNQFGIIQSDPSAG